MHGMVLRINEKGSVEGQRGLHKLLVENALVTRTGLMGDFNRHRTERKPGNLDQAVLIMPFETIKELNKEGWPIQPGDLGENITSSGIFYEDLRPGTLLSVGAFVKLRLEKQCTPCGFLVELPYVGKEKLTEFLRVMKDRRGVYASVVSEGTVEVADAIVELE